MDRSNTIAVLGCGRWGRNIVRCLGELGVPLVVVDPAPEGRKQAESLAPIVRVVEDAEAVWRDASIDAVMIATPAETHFALATAALAAGKDVFVEKPMTVDAAQARTLVEDAAARDRLLMVGHLLEYHPAILKLHELIRAGELGHVRYVISNRLNLGKIRTEENALWSFAPHDIAVMLRLVGAMPVEVVATGGAYVTPNVADVTVTQLLFDNGVRGHVFVSWLHPFKEQKLVVVGSKRMASFCDVSKELVLYDQRVAWEHGEPVPVKGEGTPVEYDAAEPLKAEVAHFLDCVRTHTAPRTDGRSGLRVLEVLEAAQRSIVTNGRPVACEHAGALGIRSAGRPAAVIEAAPVVPVTRTDRAVG